MLKIVYPVCCGMSVHKKIVIVVETITSTNTTNVTTYQTNQFNTYSKDLYQLKEWLSKYNYKEVYMESTGKYWIPICNILENSCTVTLANPWYVKNIPGKKTDKRDVLWLADLHKHGLISGSFIPPKNIRELRDLMGYRFKLTNFRSSEKNRFQNTLTVSNIMISSVVSDTFGKSSSAIIKYAMEHPNNLDMDYSQFLHKSMISKADESAGKKKNVHISRAGAYLKPTLILCANAAIKDNSCPYFKHRYESIKKIRGHKRAIIDISRMLLTCIYNMLLKNEAFDNSIYKDYLKRENSSNHINTNIDRIILFLQSQGFEVAKPDKEISPNAS